MLFDPGEVEQLVTDQVGGSALFASRFRECAGRALLLPRRSPGKRTPLWQQRQRAAQLLEVAGEFGSFPIVLEAVRECLQDVFDLPGLVELMRDLESRAVRLVEVTTAEPSPFARSLLFGYVAQYLYEGDSPLAERRAAALALDSRLLAELLGQAELRELIDPAVLAELEAELQRLTPERRIKDVEGVADALRLLGPLSTEELLARGAEAAWRPSCGRPAGPFWSRSPASSAGPRSRTPGGSATHSAPRCRSASPRPSPSRSRIRSATCWPGSPGPTGRSPPRRRPPGSAWATPWSPARCSG